MENQYKLLQLFQFFSLKFSYRRAVFGDDKPTEIWLINAGNSAYQLIRISLSSIGTAIFEKERTDRNIMAVSKSLAFEKVKFLDIHICREEVLSDELYDSICIDDNYYSGIDLSDIYPGIKRVVHVVSNPEAESADIIANMNINMQKARRQKKALDSNHPYLVTIIIICLCLLVYIGEILLNNNYSSEISLIVMGADYTAFTKGLHQFYRLLTYGFTHGSVLHLTVNMLSLYSLGSYYEPKLGHLKFTLILFSGIISSALFAGIFNGNTIICGISGALYTYLSFMVLDTLINKRADSSFYRMLFINFAINFIPNVEYMGHIGGFIFGCLLYFLFFDNRFKEKKRKYSLYALIIIFLLLETIFYSAKPIEPIYGGTDAQVVQVYRDLGLDSYADHIADKLINFYIKER